MADQPTSSYVVLRQVKTDAENAPVAWIEVGSVSARSQQDAIKAAADTTNPGTYAAVPERSWAPIKVVPKTVTTFDLAEIKPMNEPVAAPAAGVTA